MSPQPSASSARDLTRRTTAQQLAIAQSHERSLAFGLRPHESPDLTLLTRSELNHTQQSNRRLGEHAMPVMEMLFEHVAETRSMVVLTDNRGTILHALGDPAFLDRAHRVALAPGADWSERAKGTNGIGTALFLESPTLVHANQHFMRAHHFLTCAAAPIFDHRGDMMGLIDVSGDRHSFHPHSLTLARMSARMIEQQWFSERFSHGLRMHFHPSERGLGTMREGVIAFDADGQVLGVNRCAIELLHRTASELRRESAMTLFGLTVGKMLDHARRMADAPMQLVLEHFASQVDRSAERRAPQWAGGPGEPNRALNMHDTSMVAQTLFARAAFGLPTGMDRGHARHPGPQRHAAADRPTAKAVPPRVDASRNADRPPGVETHVSVRGTTPATGSSRFDVSTLQSVQLETIRRAVEEAGGNISRAAKRLGISRNTIYRKLG